MKKLNILRSLAATLLLTFANLSNAQSKIYGNWTGTCALEKTEASSISFCGICPSNFLKDNSMEINTIEIYIDEKSVRIGNNLPVFYKWDDNTSTIKFTFEKTEYIFKVLSISIDKTSVWKEASGSILILQRK